MARRGQGTGQEDSDSDASTAARPCCKAKDQTIAVLQASLDSARDQAAGFMSLLQKGAAPAAPDNGRVQELEKELKELTLDKKKVEKQLESVTAENKRLQQELDKEKESVARNRQRVKDLRADRDTLLNKGKKGISLFCDAAKAFCSTWNEDDLLTLEAEDSEPVTPAPASKKTPAASSVPAPVNQEPVVSSPTKTPAPQSQTKRSTAGASGAPGAKKAREGSSSGRHPAGKCPLFGNKMGDGKLCQQEGRYDNMYPSHWKAHKISKETFVELVRNMEK